MVTDSASVRAFTECILQQFVTMYDIIKETQGFDGPKGDKLYTWMIDDIYDNTEDNTENRNMIYIDLEKNKKYQQDEEETFVQETSTKVDGRLLKKVFLPPETKTNKKGESISSRKVMDLPYMPHCIDYTKCCQALSLSGGLYSPCMTRPVKGSLYCKSCEGSNFKYGKLSDRETCVFGEYKDPSGRSEISWGTWTKRRNLNSDKVNELIKEALGEETATKINIPESYYILKKNKKSNGNRGRTSNKVNGVKEPKEKKKRGRPVKKTQDLPPKPVAVELMVAPPVDDVMSDDEISLGSLCDESDILQSSFDKSMPQGCVLEVEFLDKNPENDMQNILYAGNLYCYDLENDVYNILEDGTYNAVGLWNPVSKSIKFYNS